MRQAFKVTKSQTDGQINFSSCCGGVTAMLVYQSGAPRWRLHIKLYKTHNF